VASLGHNQSFLSPRREEHEEENVRAQERKKSPIAFFSFLFRSFVFFVLFVVSFPWLRPKAAL